MIGIFDSWSGGLTFLAEMYARFPEYSYIYFWDYDHCPYGSKKPEEILALTTIGVQKLFDAGATIVILACNTASAWSLRKLQTEIFPGKRILWVTIPGAEKAVNLHLKQVTVFATQQTVNSRTYRERMGILDESVIIEEIALPATLVEEIESLLPVHHCHSEEDFKKIFALYDHKGWKCDSLDWEEMTQKYFSKFQPQKGIILWCTHYSYLKKPLKNLFWTCSIIDPSEEAAKALDVYLKKHTIFLEKKQNIQFI